MEGRKKQKGQRQRDGRPDGGQANNKKDSRTEKQREAEGSWKICSKIPQIA